MLTRRTKAYSSSCSQIALVYFIIIIIIIYLPPKP